MRKGLPCGLFVLWLVTGGAAGSAEGGTLTPEMVVRLRRVTEVAAAPDGARVAYTLQIPRGADDPPGRAYSQIWIAPTDGGAPRPFTRSGEQASDPAWSPEGRTITFLAARGEDDAAPTQLYAIPADGGEAQAWTESAGSVSAYRWAPGGDRVAYTARDPKREEEKAAAEKGYDQKVFDERPRYRRLWLLEGSSRQARRLVDRDLDVVDLVWTPDGSQIVFRAAPTPRIDDEYMQTRLYRVAATGGEPALVTATEGKLGAMEVSPDGRRLAYLGAVSRNDPLAQSLFVVPLAGGTPRNLTEGLEASATDLRWLDDDTLLLAATEGEASALYRVTAASGERSRLPWEGLVLHDLDLAGSTTLVVAADSRRHPAELFVAPLGGAPRRLSHSNDDLEEVRLARQEVVEWRGAGGWPIRGILTYPLDYRQGERYPLVLQIHGGPEGVSLDGWTTSPGYPVQLLAAAGFVVLEPNYRGSGGRGVTFSKGDHDDLGGAEFEDVLAGVDALAARGLVDPERVGTGGWSYGGYLSAWAATRHTERFRAALVGAGLTDWVSFTGTTDIPYEMSLVHWDSWWFDEPELHWRRSPMAYLNQAATPTLIVTGAADERVNPEQSLELYTGLRIKGVPTQLVTYPREPHGLREPAHQLDYIARTLGWFGRYLGVPTVAGDGRPRD